MAIISDRCRKGLLGVMLGTAALALTSSNSLAQVPPGPPPGGGPGAGGPPPGGFPAGGPPRGPGPGGPSGGLPADFQAPVDTMTEAQQLVASLTPPFMPPGPIGILRPEAPGPDDPDPSADPRDLTGTWYHSQDLEFRLQRDMYGFRAPYTMSGARVMQRRVKSLDDATPYLNASAICRPPGQQWQLDLNMPFQIFHGDGYLEFIFEEYHGRWNVIFDQAKYPRPAQPEYMGYSVGHWDGSTLVVETTGYKQHLWLDVDGTPLSKDGKLTHRIRKVDHGDGKAFLEVITTIEDPRYYTNPWSVMRQFSWQPNLSRMREYDCEEQIGDPYVNADAGLVPEPEEDPA